MTTNGQSWKSPRLALYGLVFRVTCNVAQRAGERAQAGAQVPRRMEKGHHAQAKGRSPLPLELEAGQ